VAAEEAIKSLFNSSCSARYFKEGRRRSDGAVGIRKEDAVQLIKPAIIETLSVGGELDGKHHSRIIRR
jgi:hypothetical protein